LSHNPNFFNAGVQAGIESLKISNTFPPTTIIPWPAPNLSVNSALVIPLTSNGLLEPLSITKTFLPSKVIKRIEALTPSILTEAGPFFK